MIRIKGFGAGRTYNEALRLADLRKGTGNFTWSAELPGISRRSTVAADLLRVGRAIHLADRLVRRSSSIRTNLRRIDLEVRVAEPAKWRRVRRLIEELAEFATGGDAWSISFTSGASDDVLPIDNETPSETDYTMVSLFSGGLDSLCSAAYLAAQKKSRPIFVTHSPPGWDKVHDLVRDLFHAFGRELPPQALASYRLVMHESDRGGSRSLFQEPSRRTRPIFYLSLACATAVALEVCTIQMGENGALALSLPYRYDAHGPSVARQAHTFLLAGFETLLRHLMPGVSWSVTNPFLNRTKGEACQVLGPASHLAKRSESCEYLGRQRAVLKNWMSQHPRRAKILGNGPQCGLCVPCIVRRAALKRAGISDPESEYFVSAPHTLRQVQKRETALQFFGEQAPPPLLNMLVPNALYMQRHCNWLAESDLTEFAVQYLPELRSSRQVSGTPTMDLAARHALAKRYAREMLAFLNG